MLELCWMLATLKELVVGISRPPPGEVENWLFEYGLEG